MNNNELAEFLEQYAEEEFHQCAAALRNAEERGGALREVLTTIQHVASGEEEIPGLMDDTDGMAWIDEYTKRALLTNKPGVETMKTMTDQFRRGMEHAANMYEQINPASDAERLSGSPGAGAMGAVIEYRDLIRAELGKPTKLVGETPSDELVEIGALAIATESRGMTVEDVHPSQSSTWKRDARAAFNAMYAALQSRGIE